ncbi:hypothetical protein JHK86_049194 [Glycine max]|nr:hypothetical protein JHK86_049194 [Glycine max]
MRVRFFCLARKSPAKVYKVNGLMLPTSMPPLSVSRSLPAASPMPSCKVALSSLSDNDKSEHGPW